MKDPNYPEISVAEFAANLMKEDKVPLVPAAITGGEKALGPDLRKVEPINEDEVQNILQKSFGLQTPKKIVKVQEKKEEKKQLTVEQATIKLLQLIKEAQQLITEMTSCGMIGVNQASGGFTKPKKKKIDKKKFTKINVSKILKRL